MYSQKLTQSQDWSCTSQNAKWGGGLREILGIMLECPWSLCHITHTHHRQLLAPLVCSKPRHIYLKSRLLQQHTKLGPCHANRQNLLNSVLHLGHNNGAVTVWSQSSSEYLVKIRCHKGSLIICQLARVLDI
mmetsp:Transcript_13173/g.24231  ORF Transcript_13173/g.24231 Transcript_13173/m.24231 type:complete len:132 (+) Transcript_13173:316-711(+)